MDFDSLKSKVSNLTLYDLKAGVRQLQNAVMNYTEMESKVREATNNEPWGASSTLMQEIANGTFNYQLLNEIMPMIYHRFTEKTAEQWRQIYKALQLLEFLIKNGSERVIDDARGHLSLLKMLKQFHFIDANGKDQGINVRNRSKELVDLLSDVDKIRTERKKAKSNKTKYAGYEGGGSLAGFNSGGAGAGSSSSDSRYGGFGSESAGYGAYDGRVYGDGGGFGGQSSDYQDTQARRDNFEEYDEFEDGSGAGGQAGRKKPSSPTATSSGVKRESGKKAEPVKAKQPEVDLFSFDDELASAPASSSKASASLGFGSLTSPAADEEDEFDDFQSAPAPAPAAPAAASNAFALPALGGGFAAPKPQAAAPANLFSAVSPPLTATGSTASSTILSPAPSVGAPALQPRQTNMAPNYQPAQPNYFTSVSSGVNPTSQASARPTVATTPGGLGKPLAPIGGSTPKPSGDAFAGLLSGMGGPKKEAGAGAKSTTMADLARQKASAGIWGAGTGSPASIGGGSAAPKPAGGQQKIGGGLDDLLG